MKTLIFSDSWFEKFRDSINSNKNYERYASDWEGDIVLSIRGDQQSHFFRSGEFKNVRLELFHGRCNSISFPTSIGRKDTPYVLDATATTWEKILSGKTNVVTAMLRGEVTVTGDLRKLMKYINAAQELVISAGRID